MTDVYDAGDPRHVRLAAKAAKVSDRQSDEIIRGIMSLAAGRAWMLALLEACHCFATSYQGNALGMAFAEGERNVGLKLLNDIMRSCPDQYVEMMRERGTRDLTAESRRRRTDTDGGDRSSPAEGPGDQAVARDED